jgi:hypothetical protein
MAMLRGIRLGSLIIGALIGWWLLPRVLGSI